MYHSTKRCWLTAAPDPTGFQGVNTMANLAGGWSSKSVDDEEVKEMVKFAVPRVQEGIKHSAFFKLRSIESAEAQVRCFIFNPLRMAVTRQSL